MITAVKRWFSVLLVLVLSCTPETDEPIPFLPFADIVINTSLPEFYNLQFTGGYKNISGGVKGIIVYHATGANYNAFERNCSFQPNDACSTVEVENTGVRMHDPCCGSIFNFEGFPVSGPARNPLRQYRVNVTGTVLTITDEVIN
jgi:Rieske Fe-S protein